MALVCSSCGRILKTGHEFTEEEWKALNGEIDLGSQYCVDCEHLKKEEPKDETTSNIEHIKNILPHIRNDENFQLDLYNSLMKKIKK